MPLQPTNTAPGARAIARPGEALSFEAPVLTAPSLAERRREREERLAKDREAGHAEGFAHGLEAAAAEVTAIVEQHTRAREEMLRAARMLQDAAADLAQRRAQALTDAQHDVFELALILAEEIVGRELTTDVTPIEENLRRAFELLPADEEPVVRVHPDDAAHIRDEIDAAGGRNAPVEVVADPAVEPGGCVVAAGERRIDVQIGLVFERVRAALR